MSGGRESLVLQSVAADFVLASGDFLGDKTCNMTCRNIEVSMPASEPTPPFEHPDAIPLGQSSSMQEIDGWVYDFSNLDPINCHAADDPHHRNRRIRFPVAQCSVKPVALTRRVGISARTVQRHVKRFRDEGKAGIHRHAPPRGRVVVNARMARRATSLLAGRKSGCPVAATLRHQACTGSGSLRLWQDIRVGGRT